MRKLNIHPKNKARLILKLTVLILSVMSIGCFNNDSEVSKYRLLEKDLTELLSAGRFIGKVQGQRYLVKNILAKEDPLMKKLENAGILNDGAFITYSSISCISLTMRVNQNGDSFTDKVIINNLNEGQFACNINELYTMNQDEKVNRLSIKVNKLSALLNLFTVEN